MIGGEPKNKPKIETEKTVEMTIKFTPQEALWIRTMAAGQQRTPENLMRNAVLDPVLNWIDKTYHRTDDGKIEPRERWKGRTVEELMGEAKKLPENTLRIVQLGPNDEGISLANAGAVLKEAGGKKYWIYKTIAFRCHHYDARVKRAELEDLNKIELP